MRRLTNMIAVLVFMLGVASALYMYVSHKDKYEVVTEQKENIYAEEILRLKEAERKSIEQSERAEKIHAEEIARLKESEHRAIVERSRAQNEADSLRAENESMNDTVKRYKNQLEAMKKENEKLKAEVDRLTKKLNNSLVRIANPFK